MTFKRPFPFTLKGMIAAFGRQRLLADNHPHYLYESIHVFAALLGQGKFLFKFAGSDSCKQRLAPQVRQQFFKRVKPLSRNVAPHHGAAFLNSGGCFVIIAHFSGLGIAVLSAKGAFVIRRRREGQYNRPRWHFVGNVNGKPAADRDFYGLRNGHSVSIA